MALRDFALMVLICIFWGSNNIVTKYAVTTLGAPPLLYGALRFGLLAVAIAPWLFPMPRPRWRILLVSALLGVGGFGLVFIGLRTATASSVAIVTQASVPVAVVMSVILLSERISFLRGLGVLLSLAGVLAVMWKPGALKLDVGLVYVLFGAVFSATGSVMMKQIENIKPLQLQAWVALGSSVPMLALSAVFERDGWGGFLDLGWPLFACILYSAVLVSLFAQTAFYGLLRRYDASVIMPVSLLMPIATIAMGIGFFGEHLTAQMVVGGVLAMIGVLVLVLRPDQISAALLALRSRR